MKRVIRTESMESECARNEIIIKAHKAEYRDGFRKIISSNGPYICFLTLKFQRSYPDLISIKSANELFHRLNRQVYGRKWFSKQLGFTGTVVAEQNKSRASTAGDLHFHCLINPNSYLSDIKTDGDLISFRDLAGTAASKLIDANGKAMCSFTGGVDIKVVKNTAGLTGYLTKEFDEYVSESGDQIYFLTYEGLQDGCLDQWRKRAC